jgi:hypothetical protein
LRGKTAALGAKTLLENHAHAAMGVLLVATARTQLQPGHAFTIGSWCADAMRKPDDAVARRTYWGIKAKRLVQSRPTAVFFLILRSAHENSPLIAASAVAGRVSYTELERELHLP